mmetsp:Transcript_27482/g.89928  ORF Transcript_27482/g.89928 Transcript_27482/m.89928 type:complete len:266 (+) Transcript_27482:2884-3681(+)
MKVILVLAREILIGVAGFLVVALADGRSPKHNLTAAHADVLIVLVLDQVVALRPVDELDAHGAHRSAHDAGSAVARVLERTRAVCLGECVAGDDGAVEEHLTKLLRLCAERGGTAADKLDATAEALLHLFENKRIPVRRRADKAANRVRAPPLLARRERVIEEESQERGALFNLGHNGSLDAIQDHGSREEQRWRELLNVAFARPLEQLWRVGRERPWRSIPDGTTNREHDIFHDDFHDVSEREICEHYFMPLLVQFGRLAHARQ